MDKFFGFLIYFILTILNLIEASAPCKHYMSVSLVNGTKLKNGTVFSGGIMYNPEVQYTEAGQLRGCPCKIMKCIRMCCNPGEAYHGGCHKSSNLSNNFLPPIPQNTLDPDIRDLNRDFYIVYSSDCLTNARFNLILSGKSAIPSDKFYISSNGFLTLTRNKNNVLQQFVYEQERYCIGWSDVIQSTRFRVCNTVEETNKNNVDNIKRWSETAANVASIFFLFLTFIVYSLFSSLRNLHGKTLMAYIACMAIAYSVLPFIKHKEVQNVLLISDNACRFVAYIVHFSFLASFFWLNIMCFDIWWTFGGFRSLHGTVKQREKKKFIIYSVYAWGCASLLTISCMIMDLVPSIPMNFIRPEFGKGSCWFESHVARAIYFYGPMGVTVLCNICLFILTALKILQHKTNTARQLKGSDSKRHDDNKQWFNLYLKLFIVMGINWSMEIISWLLEDKLPKYVWYITDLTNTLQGVIIFIIFVWKGKIKRLLFKRFGFKDSKFISRNFTTRSMYASSTFSKTTCVSVVPLQEKFNNYEDPCENKRNINDGYI